MSKICQKEINNIEKESALKKISYHFETNILLNKYNHQIKDDEPIHLLKDYEKQLNDINEEQQYHRLESDCTPVRGSCSLDQQELNKSRRDQRL